MSDWERLPDDTVIQTTIAALKKNGIEALVVEDGEAAKREVLARVPAGSDVMTNSSVTLTATGIAAEIDDSGRFISVRKKLLAMDRATQGREIAGLRSTPAYALGSVHAVTVQGEALIASFTGSQLGGYAFGAGKVIWVVGAQKIVPDVDAGIRRIYEHSFVLEDQRSRKVLGRGSSVNKILRVNQETVPGRITLIFVKQVLGY